MARHRETLKTWNPQQRDETMGIITTILGAIERNTFETTTVTVRLLVDGESEVLRQQPEDLFRWIGSGGTLLVHIAGPHDSGAVWWEDTPEGPFGPTAEWSSSAVQRFLASLAQCEDAQGMDDLEDYEAECDDAHDSMGLGFRYDPRD